MSSSRYSESLRPNQISTPQALELVRNNEAGEVHPVVHNILEEAILTLWQKIQAYPDSYVMAKDEFAVFNYFRARFRGSEVARRAVGRFWNNFVLDRRF